MALADTAGDDDLDRAEYNKEKYMAWLQNQREDLFDEDKQVFEILNTAGTTMTKDELIDRFMEREVSVHGDRRLAASLVQEAILKLLNQDKIICVEHGYYSLAKIEA